MLAAVLLNDLMVGINPIELAITPTVRSCMHSNTMLALAFTLVTAAAGDFKINTGPWLILELQVDVTLSLL